MMNSSEYYTQSLELQRQATSEQTAMINEIKSALDGSGAEQLKALQEGFEKLSKAIGSLEIPAVTVQPASQGSKGNTYITITSPYYDYYWQWWRYYYTGK